MVQKRRIAVVGATGSIGRQALEVIAANPDLTGGEDRALDEAAMEFGTD